MKKHIYNIYPEMLAEDYLALKNDIQNNGYDQKYPIWLYNGDILDGWNRQKVCDELNITPIYNDFAGTDSEAFAFVIRSNNRRDLTPYQRACIALDSEPLFEKLKKEAKERQIAGGKYKGRQKAAEPKKDDNKTDTKIAKLYHTNRTYVQKMRKIKKENPVLFEKIKAGEVIINKTNIKGIFTGEEEWYTPAEIIEKARLVMKTIDIDPASSDIANKTVKATTYYTNITNGLDKEWHGNLYMNPPFSNAISAFINKLCEQLGLGNVKQAIIVTNNSTDTDWFQKLKEISNVLCFTDGRIKFYNSKKKPNITHGQAVFYIGENEEKFMEHFSSIGYFMKKFNSHKELLLNISHNS
jgi:phage N-6-adenine-methyltransferase